MSKEYKLTPEQEELLRDPKGVFTVVSSYLTKAYGAVSPAKYNKIVTELGYDKENKQSLVEMYHQIFKEEEHQGYAELASLAMGGKIGLSDLKNYYTEEASTELVNDEAYDLLSPQIIRHQEVLAGARELAKVQREGAHLALLFKGLQEQMGEELKNIDTSKYIRPAFTHTEEDKELILCLSDWHVGATIVNMGTGGYNFEVLKERLNTLLAETIKEIEKEGIKKAHVYFIGDAIEHINMRNVNQAFESEFSAVEQIAKAQRVLIDFLTELSKYVDITFGIVGGNHDRFQGNKADKIYNDNIAYIILSNMLLVQQYGGLPNVTIIDNQSDIYSFEDVVANKRIKVIHGDAEGKKVDVKIPKHIKQYPIDYLIMGHIHTTRIIQEDYSRFHVYVGSTMGANNYSKENNLPTTSPAQLILVLDGNSDAPMFKPVFL